MQRKPLYLMLVLALLLFSFGCISEPSVIDMNSQTQVQSKTYLDIGSDGAYELAYIKFSPLSTASEGQKLSIERSILIYPTSFDAQLEMKDATAESIKQLALETKTEAEKAKAKCQFNHDICIDEGTCAKACYSNTCKRSQDTGTGAVIYDFSAHEKKLFLHITELEAVANSAEPLSDSKKLGDAVAGAYIESEILKMHPAKDYLSCYYDSSQISQFLSSNKLNVKSKEYSALALFELKGFGLKDPIELSIKDVLPSSVTSKYLDVKVSKLDTFKKDIPPYIEFFPRKISESGIILTSYQVKLSDSFSLKSAEEWKNSEISMKVFSNDSQYAEQAVALMMQVFAPIYSITGLLAVSLSLSVFLLMSLLSIILELVKLMYYIGYGTVLGRSWNDSVLKAFGKAKPNPLKRLATAIILIAVSILLEFFFPVSVPSEMALMQLLQVLQESPTAFLVVSFAIFSFTIFGDLAGEFLKGLIAGKQFYRDVLEATPKINKLKLEKLKQLIAETKKELETYSARGINTSDELAKLSSIPISVLEASMETENPAVMSNKLEAYVAMASESLAVMKQKDEEASKSWELWKNYIAKELSQRDTVDINNFFEIPQQLRTWAASKYIEETKEQDLVMEGSLLKKVTLSLEEKARKLVSGYVDSGAFKAILLIKDGSVIAYSGSLPKKTLAGNFLLAMLSSSTAMAKSFKAEHAKYILSKTADSGNIVAVRSEGRYQVAFIGSESSMQEAENLINKILKM